MKFKVLSFSVYYKYFVFFWLSVTNLFSDVVLLCFTTSIKVLIDTIFISLLIAIYIKKIKFCRFEILFIFGYLALTFLFLIFYVDSNYFGFIKLFNNSLLTITQLLEFYLVYKIYKDEYFTGFFKKLFSFEVFLQIGLFVLFILFNKKNGLVSKSLVQGFIFQDWKGRFQGTFSEPSVLGLFLGVACFIIILGYSNKSKYLIFILLLFILYTSCKAKFSVLAIPFSIFVAIFSYNISFYDRNYKGIFFAFILICLIALFFDSFIISFFNVLKSYIDLDGAATYATRFFFIFTSIKKACLYPLGSGIGLNYEFFRNSLDSFIFLIKGTGFDTFELLGYQKDPTCLGSKDCFSLFLSFFGFIGIFLHFKYFQNLLTIKSYKTYFSHCLILFVFIQSLFCPGVSEFIYLLIFMKLVLNQTAKNKQ